MYKSIKTMEIPILRCSTLLNTSFEQGTVELEANLFNVNVNSQ